MIADELGTVIIFAQQVLARRLIRIARSENFTRIPHLDRHTATTPTILAPMHHVRELKRALQLVLRSYARS